MRSTDPNNPEAARLLWEIDWSRNPLGPFDAWPAELKTLSNLMVRSKSPQHIVWGPEQILLYNDGYIPVLGDRHPKAFGMRFAEVWPDIWEGVAPIVERTYAGVADYFEDHPWLLDRGDHKQQVWISFAYTPIENEEGEVLGFHCTFHETTASVLARQERDRELDRLRQMFEQAPGFIALLSGPQHVYTLSNAAYSRLVGGRDVVGKAVAEALPEAAEQGFVALLDQVYATGERFVGSRVPVDLEDAAGRLERRYVDVVYQPILDAVGRVTGVFVEGSDVTSHHDAEQELRALTRDLAEAANATEEERARLDALLQAAPVGIGYAGRDGRLTLVNQANLDLWGQFPLGKSPDEYDYWKAWWADDSERHGQPLQARDWALARALRGEDVAGDVVQIEPFDAPGTRRTLLLRATPVRTPNGETSGAVVVQIDISDRVAAEARLRANEAALRSADQRKDEFLAMLAHELRNPLAPIRTAAEVITMPQTSPDFAREAGQLITRQVGHMTKLVDDLLDVSRVTRGRVRLELEVLDLREAVHAAIEQVRPLVESRSHALATRVASTPLWVRGERTRLVQVVANLLANAARYTAEGGSIEIDARIVDGGVRVAVRDNGAGIDGDLLPHVFELFTQGAQALDRSQGGLGIGLALVKGLADLHGGRVVAESAGPGHGSRFVLDLPMAAEGAQPPRPSVAPAGSAYDSLQVVVVDDNADAAATLALLLEAAGHRVATFCCAEDLLASPACEDADVFVLDIGLPDMDGRELARRLRTLRAHAHPLLLALSGYGRDDDRSASLDAGFDEHYVKPIDGQKLIGILQRSIAMPADTATSP